ncbi:hypothetical protein [Nonomuraea typhae]|uniref:hypothetical protein n=1 Tax=Nonomuraea typhae TaxID=2603600 RepID=UPI0012FC5AC3|nr:hypothetical protein [Nonomuraea typhae]
MCKHGTDVYIGTHSRSDLYKLDTITGATVKLAEYPDHSIWTMAAAPDGTIYMGMSEPGRVARSATRSPPSSPTATGSPAWRAPGRRPQLHRRAGTSPQEGLGSPPVTSTAKLAAGWFGGGSRLAIAPDSRALYGLKGRNLVSIAIRP